MTNYSNAIFAQQIGGPLSSSTSNRAFVFEKVPTGTCYIAALLCGMYESRGSFGTGYYYGFFSGNPLTITAQHSDINIIINQTAP